MLRVLLKALMILGGIWTLGFVYFAQHILGPPEKPDQHTDAIVVLTGGQTRLEVGFDLLKQEKAKWVFVSGVHPTVTKQYLLNLHKTEQRLRHSIVLGKEASNTLENAQETAAWIRGQHIQSVRLITANYHMPRSLLEFHRALPGIVIIPHPVSSESVKPREWWMWPGTTWLLIREYNKYIASLVAGGDYFK